MTGFRRNHLQLDRSTMGSCWGSARKFADWWFPRELPWRLACKRLAPGRLVCLQRRTSPSMVRSSWLRRPYVGSGSTGWLGSWWQSTRRCGWPELHRSSTRRRPGTRGCSSTRQRGSTVPVEHGSVRSDDQSCDSGSCRTDLQSGCSSTSQP